MRTVGVEEELLLVDPGSGAPVAVAGSVLARAASRAAGHPDGEIEAELQQQQIEVETTPTTSLADLGTQVRDWRRRADELGRASGARAVALATSPLPVDPRTTVKSRYQAMIGQFGLTTLEQLTCGCHVHVGIESDDEGAGVINRVQPWLPVLLALSANSPFWDGRDSGYASYRSQAGMRFPTTGPTRAFRSGADYRGYVDDLVATGVPLDGDMIYFYARLSRHYPTVEIRIADVCARTVDTVLIAGLVRALVDTAAAAWRAGEPAPATDPERLRLATWRAGRSGLAGDLIDPVSGRPQPAAQVIDRLLEHVDAALGANGDRDTVHTEVRRVQADGNGASRQRAVLERTGDLAAVVRASAELTQT
ncbi:glutamate--cysteine ligase [Microlunatus sp. GCM10028923]|uniref:carboxylate-amine ligase n=1 Tax=Microlunatus sp. GCM10028923 TaxID=3273400 RepID=UPI00361FF95B